MPMALFLTYWVIRHSNIYSQLALDFVVFEGLPRDIIFHEEGG